MKLVRYVGVAVLASLVGLGSAGGAQGCTVTLTPGQSIQEAINRANQGAVICLAAGEWKENVSIETSLTLRAAEVQPQPDVVIESAKEGWPVILIRSMEEIEVVLQGLKVTRAFGGCADYPICPDGISIHGHAKATLKDITISGNWRGIVMWDSSHATIVGATISGNSYNGIEMLDSAQATIQHASISDNGDKSGISDSGILIRNSAQVSLQNTVISGNEGAGIVMADSAQASTQNTTISDNIVGIWILDSAQASIQSSSISNNSYYGIEMLSFAQAAIVNTTINYSELAGVIIFGFAQATIHNTVINGNGWAGIWIWEYAQVTIQGNKIINNRRYGVACYQRPCFDTNQKFEGAVRGSKNEISGNEEADVCPTELEFLKTSAGGCYGEKC